MHDGMSDPYPILWLIKVSKGKKYSKFPIRNIAAESDKAVDVVLCVVSDVGFKLFPLSPTGLTQVFDGLSKKVFT